MRSQPGILLSGSPPSKPFSFEKRATRFIMSFRDTRIRGRVSSYGMAFSLHSYRR